MAKTKKADAELDRLVTRVIENAKSVDSLLKTSTTLVGIIVLLKLTGSRIFNWNSIELSIENYPILVFFLLSIAHFFYSLSPYPFNTRVMESGLSGVASRLSRGTTSCRRRPSHTSRTCPASRSQPHPTQ